MLKKQRIQRTIDDLSLALDFAKAMLKDGHTNAALLRLHGAMDRGLGDIVRALKDPDDYPSQHRAQFDAIVAEVQRLVPVDTWKVQGEELTAAGRRDGAGWVVCIRLTENGLEEDCWCPTAGPISHSGGRVPSDQPPEVTARSLLKAAGVQVPR